MMFQQIGQTYRHVFFIFPEMFLLMICSPVNNSVMETCKADANSGRIEISGSPLPDSHLDIVLSLKHSCLANSFWV